MNQRLLLTDDLLTRALAKRMAHEPSPRLLERVIVAAEATPQAPRPWWARRADTVAGHGLPSLVPAWSAAIATVLVLIAALLLRPEFPGPGATPRSPGQASPTSTLAQTPETVLIGDVGAQRLRLGDEVDPIDVVAAFDSVWTANQHPGDVRRFDPATMEEIARIPAGSGPSWFTVADGVLWAADEVSRGVMRIDPATNAASAPIGDLRSCREPVAAPGDIWQAACDGLGFMRIDPDTLSSTVIDARGHRFITFAGGALITTGPNGLARLDPNTGAFTEIGGPSGDLLLGSDGETVWLRAEINGVYRIDPTDGRVVATFPYPDAQAVRFVDGRAWLTVSLQGLVEIDLATNHVLRTIPLRPAPLVAIESNGALWVTDFDNSSLWKVEP
jgi:streptogramin lyase